MRLSREGRLNSRKSFKLPGSKRRFLDGEKTHIR